MITTLRAKILSIATAVSLIAITAVIATSTSVSTREYENAAYSRSVAIGKSLTIQLERLLQLGLDIDDIVGFEEQCQEIVREYEDIDVAMVANPNGEILFHSASVGVRLHGKLRQAVISGFEGVVTQDVGTETWHNVLVPAFNLQQEYVANIIVSFPANIISNKIEKIWWFDLCVGLLVLLTGIAILYTMLAQFVTRPLGDLIATVVNLRQTPLDMARRTTLISNDELGQLGKAFNELMEDLQNTTVSKTELELAMDELKRLSTALFEQKEKVEVTLHSIGDGVISVDAKTTVQYLNPVAEQLSGWTLKEATGLPLQNVLHLFDSSSKEPLPNPFEPAFFKGEPVSNRVDAELLRRDGAAIGVDYTAAPMHSPSGDVNGGVLTLRDVSNERNMAQRLSWDASHDSLTNLFNRREFTDRLDTALTKLKDRNAHHVVFFMDLDRFKVVNDTAGHAAGDQLLQSLAIILAEQVRPTDTLARLGGDEFALLLEDCPLPQGERIATNILNKVEEFVFEYQGKSLTVGMSIGIASVDGSANCTEVLTMADTACYTAKEQGRNRVCVYQIGNADAAERHRQAGWVMRINDALTNDRFTLYHQAYLSLQSPESDRIYIEVLLRLVEKDGRLVQPSAFLPAAERFNLMPAIDRWVIKKVFSQYHKLVQQRSGAPLTCSINVSGLSLNSRDLLEFIRNQAQAHSIPKGAICFEINESTAISNLGKAAEFAQGCRSLGFLLALDDFGAGASTFGYLKTFPVDFVKIDGTFVENMVTDEINKTMTETINKVGHIMGITTIAEYAQTDAVVQALQEIGVDFAQGFAVQVPAPLFT